MSDSDLIKQRIENFSQQKKRHSNFWRVFKIVFFVFLVGIIMVSTFSYKVIFSQESVLSSIGRLPVIKQFRQLMGMENLRGELDDRINFLLLGQGGVNHEGPYLTDTIIFGTLKPSANKVALISIPRDLFIDMPGHGWHKINYANSIGETTDYQDGGAAFAARLVEDIFDLPIHYWLRIDFDAFQQTIDNLNGINVCVDNAFEDYNYPTEDFEVQTISFQAGCQTMDGETALKFVRSRHGTNGEGSDFARAARQQKVILAVKNKVFSLGTLTNPQRVYNLYHSLKNNIQTNIGLSEILHFLEIAKNIDPESSGEDIIRRVLDNSPAGLLSADISDQGAYILLPRTGDYSELQNLAKNIFIIQDGHEWQPINVIVLNGTRVEGWARDTAGYLSSLNFKVLKSGNTPQDEDEQRKFYEKTVVYDLKDSVRQDVVTVLKKSLDANVTNLVPEFLHQEIEDYRNLDFLIVLGCTDCELEEEETDDDQ